MATSSFFPGSTVRNALVSWEKRLFEELAKGSDLLCVDVLGVQFGVRWGRAVTRQQREGMSAAWSRCASVRQRMLPPLPEEPTADLPFTASVAHRSVTHDGGTFHLQAASFEELAETLTTRLTLAAILANAGELTMLHACGVADPLTGAVVALVAKSGSGKTTAASVLAKSYGYVTDETVAIAHDGSVVPYPKPLSVKHGRSPYKRQVGPDELGLLPVIAMPFIQSIVLLDRVQGGVPMAPVLKKVPLADAVLALLPETSSQAKIGAPLQSLCHLIDDVGGVWQVTYSEAEDLPAVLEPLFREQPRPEPEWEAKVTESAGTEDIPQDAFRRAPAQDAVAVGGDLLVMLENHVVRLSGIGPAIWEAAAAPVPLEDLMEAVARVHGTPEGYPAAVERAAQQLAAESVLEK
ncbi:ATP-binding protein [Arthrobacter sp. SD76]|uniref:ATP-binding protein n=1 Tax=Arthrobacter sp. SD76 TaxID=3415007 RepID=UPI003C70F2D7